MTRTERNQYPAALLKDKHSRSGLDRPHEMDRKQKAGMHKAEEVRREGEYERGANDDAEAEGEGEGEGVFEMEEDVAELPGKGRSANANANANGDNTESAGEKGADATGTSPSDSTASLDSNANAKARPAQPGRRMSNVSTEEIAQARSYREGVMASGGPVNLANIARTSFGVASPPSGNGFGGLAGTSPTKYKNAAQA